MEVKEQYAEISVAEELKSVRTNLSMTRQKLVHWTETDHRQRLVLREQNCDQVIKDFHG